MNKAMLSLVPLISSQHSNLILLSPNQWSQCPPSPNNNMSAILTMCRPPSMKEFAISPPVSPILANPGATFYPIQSQLDSNTVEF